MKGTKKTYVPPHSGLKNQSASLYEIKPEYSSYMNQLDDFFYLLIKYIRQILAK